MRVHLPLANRTGISGVFFHDGLPDVAAGIPCLSYDYSPDSQVVALNRAVDLAFGAGRLPQRQYQLAPIRGASLSQLVLS